ncbi:hypothetical protein Vretimale_11012, partial [Volvox reticuliferus]
GGGGGSRGLSCLHGAVPWSGTDVDTGQQGQLYGTICGAMLLGPLLTASASVLAPVTMPILETEGEEERSSESDKMVLSPAPAPHHTTVVVAPPSPSKLPCRSSAEETTAHEASLVDCNIWANMQTDAGNKNRNQNRGGNGNSHGNHNGNGGCGDDGGSDVRPHIADPAKINIGTGKDKAHSYIIHVSSSSAVQPATAATADCTKPTAAAITGTATAAAAAAAAERPIAVTQDGPAKRWLPSLVRVCFGR